MKAWGAIILATTAATALLSAGSMAQPARERPRPPVLAEPVVIELFTAQGCAGCPEANQVVETLSTEPGVIALTYPVDYWDYLGWTDTLAQPEFTQRQRAYRQALRLRAVQTPQVIIDGRRSASAAQETGLRQAISEEAVRTTWPPEIEFRESGDQVGIGSGRAPAGGAEVVAVIYTPGAQVVRVGEGDNRGKSVRHVNVVRRIAPLGDWTGVPALFALPQPRAGDAVVVMVQARRDRRIISAAAR